jgi:alkyl hydroperoxide reductase subunit AhpF
LIPERELARIGARFATLPNRVRLDFFRIGKKGEVSIPSCDQVQEVLEDLDGVTPRIAFTVHDIEAESELAQRLGADKAPAIVLRGKTNRAVRYFGLPAKLQFPVLIESISTASTGQSDLQQDTLRSLRKLRSDVSVRVLITPECKYSPVMAFNAIRFGLQSSRLHVDVIDITTFPALLQQVGLPVVPITVVNDSFATPGVFSEADMATAILQAAEGEDVSVRSQPNTVTRLGGASRQAPASGPRRTPGGLIVPR